MLYDMVCLYLLVVYVVWLKDEEDYRSSIFGGMVFVLIYYFLVNVGIVYGCIVILGIEIKYICIDNFKDVYKLKGFKYV